MREQDDWITRLKMGEFDAVCKIRLQIADAYEMDGCWREQRNRKTIKSAKCRKAKNERKETQKKFAKLNLSDKKR